MTHICGIIIQEIGGIPLPIRWIISDLDDTLLPPDIRLTDYTLSVLSRAQQAGFGVMLASGRMPSSMMPYVRQVGTTLPFIACNGARIIDPVTGDVLYANDLALELAREATRALEELGIYCQIYHDDTYSFAEVHPYSETYRITTGVEGNAVGRLSDYITTPIIKVLAIAEPDICRAILPTLRARFDGVLHITQSKPRFIELTALNVTKGDTLMPLCKILGAQPADFAAFGDGENDAEMLAAVGLGVAMENAVPEAKAAAKRICAPNTQDGVARFIEEHLLNEHLLKERLT